MMLAEIERSLYDLLDQAGYLPELPPFADYRDIEDKEWIKSELGALLVRLKGRLNLRELRIRDDL